MSYKKIIKEFENVQNKKLEKTSFGPEEDEQLVSILVDLNDEKKQRTKEELEKLIEERKINRELINQFERTQDKITVEGVIKTFSDE